jgi:hypothetical protein
MCECPAFIYNTIGKGLFCHRKRKIFFGEMVIFGVLDSIIHEWVSIYVRRRVPACGQAMMTSDSIGKITRSVIGVYDGKTNYEVGRELYSRPIVTSVRECNSLTTGRTFGFDKLHKKELLSHRFNCFLSLIKYPAGF